MPPELVARSETFRGFAAAGNYWWVRDSMTGSSSPFWLGPELEAAVRALGQNEPAPILCRLRFALCLCTQDSCIRRRVRG